MKGILFKPWKIKFIAEHPDMEIQTRRLGGLKEINQSPDKWIAIGRDNELPDYFVFRATPEIKLAKPHYQVGEVVYIKESWATEKMFDAMRPKQIEDTGVGTVPIWYKYNDQQINRPEQTRGRWRSPMMAPEWTARYFRKITGIDVERLQEIKEVENWDDLRKEGIPKDTKLHTEDLIGRQCDPYYSFDVAVALDNFVNIWDSINPKYPWGMNPWVFAYKTMAHFRLFVI